MGIKVEKILAGDFDRIYPLLTEFRNVTKISREGWQVLFRKNWISPEDHFGYYLSEDGRPVGLLGMIFSTREIDGKPRKFCDLAAWFVQPEHRGHSISLLIPLMGRKDLTVTTFTASTRVITILRQLGFRQVETCLYIIPPLRPGLEKIRITQDRDEIAGKLAGEQLRIFQDHRDLHCEHVGLDSPEGFCHVMLNQVYRKRISIGHVDYVSNRRSFIRYANQVAWHSHKLFRFFALEAGGHMISGEKPRLAFKVNRNHAILFKSSELEASDIDILYSEVQLLGLYPT